MAEFNSANSTPQFVVEGLAREERLWIDFPATEPEKLVDVLERDPLLAVSREGERVVVRMRGER